VTRPQAPRLEPQADPPVLVIGVGNPDRGDDGAGIAVVRLLGGRVGPDVRLIEMPSNVSRLVDCWRPSDVVVLVDATASDAAPGTVRRFDATSTPLPARVFGGRSTHGFGVAEAVELARALGRLPRQLVVYGIEGARFGAETGLSAPVEAAAREVADALALVRAMMLPISRVHPRGSR
jgi:hydrogenase maturation protease